MFVGMDTKLVKESSKKAEMVQESSSKRAGEELESDNSKKQKLDESVEVEVDDEAEMKKHMEIVSDDEVAIDAIPLATKPPIIIDWKIIKEGKMGYFQIIRADGSSRRYSSMIKMLQNIDREDLETLWKLVKAKHRNTRPEEAYERVLWGDLKVKNPGNDEPMWAADRVVALTLCSTITIPETANEFAIKEMEEDSKVPLILGRPFLHTTDAVIRVKQKKLNLGVRTERMIFHIDSVIKHSYSNDDTCFSIDVIDEILEEDFDALLDEGSEMLHSIKGTILEEKCFAEFDEFMAMTADVGERMPFSLCNASVTFQRRMLAIFHDMIEESVKVSMDDFSVFGRSFDHCLNNLDKMIQRCKDAHLVLNWEKCPFMVKEGIVLGHKVSEAGLKVDKAKIDIISKLPPPTNIKGIRSFLGHADFYQRFIKDFSKISRPLTKLLKKDTPFEFNDECQNAFKILKEKLTCAPVIVSPNWSLPFELMCDASDFTVGIILEFDIEIKDRKGTKNVAADHLSQIENEETSNDSEVDDNFPRETLMEINTEDEPWFADFANYLASDIIPKGMTYQQKNNFFSDIKHYLWEETYLFKVCFDDMIRRCISGPETRTILDQCHHEPTGRHYGPNTTDKKVLDSGFYWPTIIKEAHTQVCLCEACQKTGNISKRDEMPLNNIQKNSFLQQDNGKTMKRYGVNHRFSTSYHPQTSGQVENTNIALRRILEKIVKDNPAIWSRKLDDALWAFRTAYKTPTGTILYKLIYGNNCHLPFEIEHRAYWALKNCNPDLITAGEKRMFQLHELDE
ncbi:reverse transcriptase domain-containing protein [Tanacetum coccineum]